MMLSQLWVLNHLAPRGDLYLTYRDILSGTPWSVCTSSNALFSLAAFTQRGEVIHPVVCILAKDSLGLNQL